MGATRGNRPGFNQTFQIFDGEVLIFLGREPFVLSLLEAGRCPNQGFASVFFLLFVVHGVLNFLSGYKA